MNIDIKELVDSYDNTIIEVIRSQDAPIIHSNDKLCTICINTPIHMADNLEIYKMSFKPYGKMISKPHYPGAEEFLTMIAGRLKITAGNKSTVLNIGDTARYRADTEHTIENIEKEDAEAHLVVYFPK